MKVYKEAIEETSTKEAPWYIIPADKKWYARLTVAKIIEATLASLKLKFPELSKEKITALDNYKKALLKDD